MSRRLIKLRSAVSRNRPELGSGPVRRPERHRSRRRVLRSGLIDAIAGITAALLSDHRNIDSYAPSSTMTSSVMTWQARLSSVNSEPFKMALLASSLFVKWIPNGS